MTKLGILTFLALVVIGITNLARVMLSLLIIVFCGYATYELIRDFKRTKAARFAA
jgi:hypothetical protein